MNDNPRQPLVSIITPVYNGMPFLTELIESVRGQNYPNIEHIVIDDGSKDDGATVRALERYPTVTWWTRENKGQYETQNEGLAASTGAIVTIISADDLYARPDAVSSAVDYLQANKRFDCVFGRVLDIAEDGEVLDPQTRLSGRWVATLMGMYLFVPHCGLFFRRAAIERALVRFDPSYKYAGDWEWMLRLRRSGAAFGYIDKEIACYRLHGGQTTHATGAARIRAEHRRVCRSHGTSYVGHVAIQTAVDLRSIALKTVRLVRREGVGSLAPAIRDWVSRRTVRS